MVQNIMGFTLSPAKVISRLMMLWANMVKLRVLVSASALIGVCVSVGGTIGFVGLVIPHMMRMIVGPNHKRLLPASLFGGAVFLMLADLAGRTLLSPLEIPIGVITSLVGSVVFVYIFYSSRRGK